MESHQLIVGGDFNLVLDPSLDRSSHRPKALSKSAKLVHNFMQTYKLTDPWRALFSNTRKYSYFSPVHHSYSRIDFFLIDSKLLSSVKGCEYETIVLSDHSPVVLQLTLGHKHSSRVWRFDNCLLSDKKISRGIKKTN